MLAWLYGPRRLKLHTSTLTSSYQVAGASPELIFTGNVSKTKATPIVGATSVISLLVAIPLNPVHTCMGMEWPKKSCHKIYRIIITTIKCNYFHLNIVSKP